MHDLFIVQSAQDSRLLGIYVRPVGDAFQVAHAALRTTQSAWGQDDDVLTNALISGLNLADLVSEVRPIGKTPGPDVIRIDTRTRTVSLHDSRSIEDTEASPQWSVPFAHFLAKPTGADGLPIERLLPMVEAPELGAFEPVRAAVMLADESDGTLRGVYFSAGKLVEDIPANALDLLRDCDGDLGRELRLLRTAECTTAVRPEGVQWVLRIWCGHGVTVHRAGDELVATSEGIGGVDWGELTEWDLDWQAALPWPFVEPNQPLELIVQRAQDELEDLRSTFVEETELRGEHEQLDRELEESLLEQKARNKEQRAKTYQFIVDAPLMLAQGIADGRPYTMSQRTAAQEPLMSRVYAVACSVAIPRILDESPYTPRDARHNLFSLFLWAGKFFDEDDVHTLANEVREMGERLAQARPWYQPFAGSKERKLWEGISDKIDEGMQRNRHSREWARRRAQESLKRAADRDRRFHDARQK